MDDIKQPIPRVHNFYVIVCKSHFYSEELGLVYSFDPVRLKEVKECDLEPIIVYGLTVPKLPISWFTFSPLAQPVPLKDVLHEGWHRAEGLRGHPDILRITSQMAEAAPFLAKDLAKFGVTVEVADKKEKSLYGSMAGAYGLSSHFLSRAARQEFASIDYLISYLRQKAMSDHLEKFDNKFKSGRDATLKKADIAEWLSLPYQKIDGSLIGPLDWKPASWMTPWEAKVENTFPRAVSSESHHHGKHLYIDIAKAYGIDRSNIINYD
ncbi:MAG: hypothetical protein LBO05_09350 [Deltaproteobacteria bacterium]|nr:hypothetical protein [Deltaproteobacteria bacterium]